MRGIGRQLCIEAIKKENETRLESGMSKLTPAQEDRVREGVKESYRRQFVERSKKEEELKKEEEKLRLLVETFKDNDLFDSTKAPAGLEKGLDYENKLNVLYHFAEKMMKDTKRFELSEKTGLTMDKKIGVSDIAQGARLWFAKPDGPALYAKFLKDRFNIILAPDLSSLAGEWINGNMTIKDVILSPDMIKQAESSKGKKGGDGGCDFSFDLRMLKGKVIPATIVITPKGTDYGQIKVSFKDGKMDPMSFTYSNGIIKSSMSKDGAVGKLELQALDSDKAYLLNGSFNISFDSGKAKISITLQFNRSKTKEVKAPENKSKGKK
ncbi:hypothetical protein KAZ01_02330 [Candidatus Gracilibacteria bacterium]|nr:hypothetical protein [Candidatus Gracilibacteria bacterium]